MNNISNQTKLTKLTNPTKPTKPTNPTKLTKLTKPTNSVNLINTNIEPYIELLSRNIMADNRYNQKIKTEYINTINRISTAEKHVRQLYRSMDLIILYNYLYDEIIYLTKQQAYFNTVLDREIANIFDIYLESNIKTYNHYISKL
jgi:hypothetical protein